MQAVLTRLAEFLAPDADTVIDVRAPSEYAEDHVPGAINLPVLSDAERARVGTIYTRESPFLARKIGAALVARNAAAHIEGPLKGHDGGWRPLVYCWRGGQRSNSFATILSQIGWRVQVLDGGYRSYRRAVKSALYDAPFPAPVVVLDGMTGTAKTALLHLAKARGAQVLDLESLANHRGSVFGHMKMPQPAQKGFESALAAEVDALDPARPVLVEAESSKIGALSLPPQLWTAMRAAPRIRITAPLEARAAFLTRAYAEIVADADRLDRVLSGLVRLQGRAQVEAWQAMAAAGDHAGLASDLMRRHYDPRYAKSRSAATGETLAVLDGRTLDEGDLARLADGIVAAMKRRRSRAAPR